MDGKVETLCFHQSQTTANLSALRDLQAKAELREQTGVDDIEERMRKLWKEGLEAQAVRAKESLEQ